jgi:hypothetical protein
MDRRLCGPRAGMDVVVKRETVSCREQNPGRPARKPSQCADWAVPVDHRFLFLSPVKTGGRTLSIGDKVATFTNQERQPRTNNQRHSRPDALWRSLEVQTARYYILCVSCRNHWTPQTLSSWKGRIRGRKWETRKESEIKIMEGI